MLGSLSPQQAEHKKLMLTISLRTLTVKLKSPVTQMTGVLTLSGAPTSTLHAATKAYADLKIAESILTTKGDLIARNSSSSDRLAVGSDSQILLPDSPSTTGLRWSNLVFNNDELIANDDEIVAV